MNENNNVVESCSHYANLDPNIKGNTKGCEECEKIGSNWVHLRLCLTCGHVGCCDSSKHKHGTKHFKSTNHPVIRSYEPGESWKWCYDDEKAGSGATMTKFLSDRIKLLEK